MILNMHQAANEVINLVKSNMYVNDIPRGSSLHRHRYSAKALNKIWPLLIKALLLCCFRLGRRLMRILLSVRGAVNYLSKSS